jgi:probable phosphoglycerate mutase
VIRVFLWRHGQTDWNVAQRLQGASDIELNDAGLEQVQVAAKKLAKRLEPSPLIVSSPLARARDTAAVLAHECEVDFTLDPRLAERAYGEWEGLTLEERSDRFPGELNRWRAGDEPRVSGYEGHVALGERMIAALEDHAAAADTDLVLVSHGSALRIGITMALGISVADARGRRSIGGIGNARWSQLTYRGTGEWTLEHHGVGVD